MRRAKAERLSRAVMNGSGTGSKVVLTHVGEGSSLREEWSDQPINVFVHAPLPTSMGIWIVNCGLEVLGHSRMATQFPPKSTRDPVYPIFVRPAAPGHGGPDSHGGLV